MNGFLFPLACLILGFSLRTVAAELPDQNSEPFGWSFDRFDPRKSPRVREKLGRENCAFKCKWIPAIDEMHRPLRSAPLHKLAFPSVRVLAWNVYKGREEYFQQDFATLSAGQDIVMLSEVTDGPEVKPAMEQSTHLGWDLGISFYMKGDIMTGLATGSVAQPLSLQVKRTQHKEPFVGSYKLILITTYKHAPTGLDIMALNIHGINQVPDAQFQQQIRDVAPIIAAHKGPVVFAGDFNINSDQRLPMLKAILEPLGLTRVPWENPNQGRQLDEAFTRGFEVKRARLNNSVINRASDHPALELELVPIN